MCHHRRRNVSSSSVGLDALLSDDDQPGAHELGSGSLMPNDTARRLSCDCVLETVVTDGSVVIGVGSNSRTIPGWLRRLVHHRDGGRCQHPGCQNTRWLQVHHIVHWSQGGPTDLDNLILLCGFSRARRTITGLFTNTAGISPPAATASSSFVDPTGHCSRHPNQTYIPNSHNSRTPDLSRGNQPPPPPESQRNLSTNRRTQVPIRLDVRSPP